MSAALDHARVDLCIDGVELGLSSLQRDGEGDPILFLHGFGSTKEDYADIQRHAGLDQHAVLAYDAPGFGDTHYSDHGKVDIAFLVKTALAMLDHAGIDRFHLVGHSMGGLTALMLASAHPERVLSFCNIEGNIAPEDCCLSRQIHDFPADDDQAFMDAFIERTRHAPAWSSPLYASRIAHTVNPAVVRGIFTTMVDLSDNAGLMALFQELPCPKMFMYGEQNATLSYLGHIGRHGVELAEIPQCGHFPMYANPPAMWGRISDFLR